MGVVVPVVTVGAVMVIGLGISLAGARGGCLVPTGSRPSSGSARSQIFTAPSRPARVLRAGPGRVLAAGVTAACYVVGFRRSSLASTSRRCAEFARDSCLWLGLGSPVVAISWLGAPEQPLRGAWRYWADGLELADRGGIPEFTAQWSVALPVRSARWAETPSSESSLSCSGRARRGMGALSGSRLSVSRRPLALGRELGLRWSAPALPLLGIASSSYPEGSC